ncbi:MAG: DUF4430 domain-containing protein [Clostridiales bacterium]|nr:DUF4430 domain-containing protein [Clostridiales bacterium]
MSKKKFSLILLCVILLVGILSSCRKDEVEAVEVKVDVKFVYKGTVLGEYDNILVVAEDGKPTIINAVERACDVLQLDYELTEDKLSLYKLDEYAETDTGIWLWKINGVEPDDDAGKAGDYIIKDGDKIEYYFEELEVTTE